MDAGVMLGGLLIGRRHWGMWSADRTGGGCLAGKPVAEAIYRRIADGGRIDTVSSPCLAIIHANDREDSLLYIRRKISALSRLGFTHSYHKLASFEEAREEIKELNVDGNVHGIIVQSPLFPGFADQFDCLVNQIDPEKDVDGLGNHSPFIPCTALAVLEILAYNGISFLCKHALVIGRSKIVGAPIARLLDKMDATVTVAHSETPKDLLDSLIRSADIIVSAVGSHGIVSGKDVKPGAVVIDVGISRHEDMVVGDVLHFSDQPHYYYTPVPGGVGPVTVAKLVENLVSAYLLQTSQHEASR